jgi:hypothetical protein
MAEWARITVLLPVTLANDRTAYLRFLDFLRSQHPFSATSVSEHPVTGFSHSADEPPAYKGHYWATSAGGRWVPDEIVILFLDREGPLGRIIEDARSLKATVERSYREEGSEQDEIWCTVHQIQLV